MKNKQTVGLSFANLSRRLARRGLVLVVLSVALAARASNATLINIPIITPDYSGSAPANTNGWQAINSGIYPGNFGVDNTFNVAGSPAGAMYFGNTINGAEPWIFQRLAATAEPWTYSLSVWLHNYLNTGVTQGWHYKLDLFTADPGENPTTANLIGSLDVAPSSILNNSELQFTLSVDGATIAPGELGKNLMIAVAMEKLVPSGASTTWGYVDAWTMTENIPEPSTVLLLVSGAGLLVFRRRSASPSATRSGPSGDGGQGRRTHR